MLHYHDRHSKKSQNFIHTSRINSSEFKTLKCIQTHLPLGASVISLAFFSKCSLRETERLLKVRSVSRMMSNSKQDLNRLDAFSKKEMSSSEADDSVFDHLALKEAISGSDRATAKPCVQILTGGGIGVIDCLIVLVTGEEGTSASPDPPQSSLLLFHLLFDGLQLLQQGHIGAIHPRVHDVDRHGQTEPEKKKTFTSLSAVPT